MSPTLDMTMSPYERGAKIPAPPQLVQLRSEPKQRWVPSRFNARTVGEDGRLVLWNTFTGAVCVFRDSKQVLARLAPSGLAAPLDSTGDFLLKRGFLVREGLNEVDQFRYLYGRQQWRTDLLQFHFLASEDCNFRCVYCYEKFKRGTMLPEVREGVKALVRKRAPQLSELSASWFGGEPLYGWEAVEDLSPFLAQVAREQGIPQAQNMTTNGYLLTEEKATKLLEWGCRSFQITVDGVAEDHDCKRVGRDGSPTHAVIMENLRSMRARTDKFSVVVRVNFDNKNAPRLFPFLEALSEDFGGDSRFILRFRPVGQWGGDRDDELDVCGSSDQRKILHKLQAKAREVDLRQEGGIREMARPGDQVCYAARPYNFIVGATGKLMKCTIALDDMEENIVGQIHPDGRLELNSENMARWVNPHFETDSLCQSCYVLPTCQGSACPLTRITRGERTCCGVKQNLKHEMRFTLAAADAEKAALARA